MNKSFRENKHKKTPVIGVSFCLLAGVAGVEPALTVLETAVLPLNYTPTW